VARGLTMAEDRSGAFSAGSVPEAYARYLAPQVFVPWGRELLARAAPRAGASVLDVACGPGSVTRLAAAAVGPGGHVVGCDISAPMLAVARAFETEPGAAPIEYVEGSAMSLHAADESFDVVLCQQGLQFFPDRQGAVSEFARVLARDGAAVASVWAAERPLAMFGAIGDTLAEFAVSEPFPRAFDSGSYTLETGELRDLFEAAGFDAVAVELVELECAWESPADATATIAGTPFGPLFATLEPERQAAIRARFAERIGARGPGQVTVAMTAHIVSGTAA
jgi:ubiquinone/menaquinone biosynthesis C-methylase UbiE